MSGQSGGAVPGIGWLGSGLEECFPVGRLLVRCNFRIPVLLTSGALIFSSRVTYSQSGVSSEIQAAVGKPSQQGAGGVLQLYGSGGV